MLVFISSTFRDLRKEREAVQESLRGATAEPWGMEFFASEPTTPLQVALRELQNSGAVVLVIGSYAGTLLPEDPKLTYTGAEFERAVELHRPVFPFIKTEGGHWQNKEEDAHKAQVLGDFVARVKAYSTPTHFESIDELKYKVLQAFAKWSELGRPGARKTFAETEERAAPPEVEPLFDYTQTLQGRLDEMQSLNEFLNDPTKLVGVVPGRGGIGKTKLLREWAARLSGWKPLWTSASGTWHRETTNEIPVGDVVIIADDAHRYEHLSALLALVRDLAATRRIKLVIGTRPSGINYVDETVARSLDDTQILRLDALTELRVNDTLALAEEVLGVTYRHLAPALAEISKDTPLVTVVGGRLLARGQIAPAELANQEAFRRTVFDRFISEYEGQLPAGGRPKRELLRVVAAVQPVWPQDDRFLTPAGRLLDLRPDQILQGLNSLEATGLLVPAGNQLRIAPDVLADYLLEGACVNDRGETTGFAEVVFAEFRLGFLSNLLKNLAELDWRIAQRNRASAVLTKIWGELTDGFRQGDAAQRQQLLEALKGVVPFQPRPVLELVRIAMDTAAPSSKGAIWTLSQEDVLVQIPALLEWIAFEPTFTREAVKRLWKLVKSGTGRNAERSMQVLKELAAFRKYKRVDLNKRIAQLVEELVLEPGAFEGQATPLDLVDELLDREVEHREWHGRSLTFTAFGLNYLVAEPVRDEALQLLERLLHSEDPATATRALRSLRDVLSGFLPKFGRGLTHEEGLWQNAERLRAVAIIRKRIRAGTLPVPLARQIKATLRSLMPAHVNSEVMRAAREVLNEVPESDELEIFDALCTGQWDRDIEFEDFHEASRFHQQQVLTAAHKFRRMCSDPTERIQTLERMVKGALAARVEVNGADPLLTELCRDVAFLKAFSEHLLTNNETPLGPMAGVALRSWRQVNLLAFSKWGRRLAAHPSVRVASSAASGVCYGPLDDPAAEDIEVMQELVKRSEPGVLLPTVFGLARLGKVNGQERTAIQLALAINLPDDPKVADEFCEIFGPRGVNPRVLSETDTSAVLDKLVPVRKLEEHNAGALLKGVSGSYPDLLLEFVLKRLGRYRSLRASGASMDYTPVPYRNSWADLSDLRSTSQYEPFLKRIRGLLLELPEEWYWIIQLFWSAAALDEITLSLLDEWLHSGDRQRAELVLELLGKAPRGLAVNHPVFAVHVVEECGKYDEEMLKRAISRLVSNSLSYGGVRAVGSVPSPFTETQKRAAELGKVYPEGSAAHLLFSELATTVTVWIDSMLKEDAEQFPE